MSKKRKKLEDSQYLSSKPRAEELNALLMSKRCSVHGKSLKAQRRLENVRLVKGYMDSVYQSLTVLISTIRFQIRGLS